MSDTVAGLLTVAILVAALAAVHVPFGNYLARVFSDTRHWRVERWVYRLVGVDPEADQRWQTYALAVLGFSAASLAVLYGLLRLQGYLPLSLGRGGLPADGAFNTAVAFVTNTDWQSYSGETALGHLAQTAGLTVQMFASAAVGLAVAVALVRGFARRRTDRVGSFWVDLVRGTVRVLLPVSLVAAVALVATGVVQNLHDPQQLTTLASGRQTLPGGLVASQEAIKQLGTNGGGFYGASSAHPFEGPTALASLLQVFLLLVIPFSLPRTFGRLVGDTRQGWAVLSVMAVLWAGVLAAVVAAENAAGGLVPQAVGASVEGKEQRFGVWLSALFASSTTGTSTGAVSSVHDSYTALGGGGLLLNMLLGEVAPGGVGSGLYSILVLAVVAVFLGGLMVGRTPEYLGKKLGRREVTLAALTVLAMPFAVLVGTGVALALPATRAAVQQAGPHGLSEVLYAFASAGNNNGSSFAGLAVDSPFWNTSLGLAMLVGRFVPIVLVLALAGSLARQPVVPVTAGTLPTHRPLFVLLLTGTVVVVAGLTFVPALALGPLAEGLL